MVRKISIVGEHSTLLECCGQSSLWAKCLWTEFTLGKVLVGKVPGITSIVWGYHFACKIKILLIELLKFLYKWFIMFSLKIISHTRGPMENIQSKHVA